MQKEINNEVFLSFLPLSHVLERMAGHFFAFYVSSKIYYAENMDTVGENMSEVSPTVVVCVPRFFEKMYNIKKDWKNDNVAKFICCMTLFWPNGKSYTSKGVIKGKISATKKGKNGFGYDPIFIPDGYNQTFGEMEFELKISIDHRFKAFSKIKKFFI